MNRSTRRPSRARALKLFRMAALLALTIVAVRSHAHEVRPAHLKIAETSPGRYLVQWNVPAAAGNRRINVDPIFASECVSADDQVDGFAGGASVRSWYVECPSGLADTEIRFSNLPATMIDVLVQITFDDGRYFTGIVRPSSPVFEVPARASILAIFGNYLELGVEHILFGWDHLLFVLGLTILVTDRRRLFWAVTGFTVAHSVTLALAMLEMIRVPGPPVEATIALSIILLAVETIKYQRDGIETIAIRSPWVISMAIGLVHGLGFAGALSEYGLPPQAKFLSLLAFNLGVEVGQLAFIAVLLVIGMVIRKLHEQSLKPVTAAAAYFIGIAGSFWFVQRVTGFFL